MLFEILDKQASSNDINYTDVADAQRKAKLANASRTESSLFSIDTTTIKKHNNT